MLRDEAYLLAIPLAAKRAIKYVQNYRELSSSKMKWFRRPLLARWKLSARQQGW